MNYGKRGCYYNGGEFIETTYQGVKYYSNYIIEEYWIAHVLYQDPPGEFMQLKFEYKDELDDFWKRVYDDKEFIYIPTQAKNQYGYKVYCGFDKKHPKRPVAISHISEDTVVAWRINKDDLIQYMSIKMIMLNEGFKDKFKLRYSEEYKKKLARISLLKSLQNELERRQEIEEQQSNNEDDDGPTIAEQLGIDIDEFTEFMEDYLKSQEKDNQ